MGFAKRVILIVCWAAFVGGGTVQAEKSVFIISKHFPPSQAQAYAIEADQVTYEAQVDIDTYNPGNGAVGNAVWSDKELMFVTYESSPMIVWASTEDLQKVGEFDTDVYNLSGITVDHEKERIYVVRRDYPNLYVYSFDEGGNTLVLEGEYYLQVPVGSLRAWGIGLDETDDLLYISTNTERVHVYNTADWTHSHYIDITVNATPRSVVGIAVDEVHGYLYTGDWDGHNNLVRTQTSPPYAGIEVEITKVGSWPKSLLGIDVDDDTGLVYCTTYHNDFRVYDSSLVLKDTEENGISGPGGVAVPRGDAWYKPDWFALNKNDDVVDCVSPTDQFTYTISYGANGYADTGVVVIDYLPMEVDYVSCTGAGVYDSPTHSVTWYIGDISGADSGILGITVQVNYLARPGDVITNAVEMEGDLYHSRRTVDTDICCAYPDGIIYVDLDATGYNNGTSWDDAYTDLQGALARVRMCPGAATAIWVAAGTYKPTESPSESDATFELIDGIDMYAHFGGVGAYETTIGERDFDNPANETRLDGQIGTSAWQAVRYVVTAENITDLVFDGFTVRGGYNGAGILIDECPNADLRIVRCRVEDNHQYGIQSSADAESASQFELQDCAVVGNSTHGVVCSRSCPLIVGTTFDGDNQTQRGISASQSAVYVYDSVVNKHTASGIYANDADLVMEDCSIGENLGDGVWSVSFCYVDIARSVISSNGLAGIYLENSLETRITNNWIYDNIGAGSQDYYAGVYLNGAIDQAQIRNNTICNNNTHGIYLESGTEPDVVNCIVYGNAAQIGAGSGEPLGTVSYSCIEGEPYPGQGNITSDPLFLDEGARDYHITENSECVDAGKPGSTEGGETDIDGNPRVMDDEVDIGADEDYPHCDPTYADWVLLGRPDCWMTPYQCDGDAAVDVHSRGYRVYNTDLLIFSDSWKKGIGDPGDIPSNL